MASSFEGYSLGWNDYATNFSISLTDLLKRKELVDVTLIADGHLFNAHRLVLSALSPYFQQIFAQMPTNQQAFGKFFIFGIFINIQLSQLKIFNFVIEFS